MYCVTSDLFVSVILENDIMNDITKIDAPTCL